MPVHNSDLVIVLQIFCGLFFFNRKKTNELKDETDLYHKSLLCRFVTDSTGKKIGESISIDDDIVIIKSRKKFLGVPLKHIEDNKKNLLVKGLVDFDKAYEMGEKWRERSFSELEQKIESRG